MRVTLVIATISGGGPERVATNMANYWAASGWEVTILTTDFNGQTPCYDLDPRVTHLDLGGLSDSSTDSPVIDLLNDCSESERAVLQPEAIGILKLREAISRSRPEVVVSYLDLTNICTLLATRGLGLPVLVSEQCDPNQNFIGEEWEQLRRRLYAQASYVAVLTEESLDYFSSVPGIRSRIIPNAVTAPVFSNPDEMPRRDRKTLMAMGRLAHEKGFDLLLHAFALVAKKHADWTLEIWGEGPTRAYLESRIQKHGLAERALLPGFTSQPFDALRRADLFVLSSLDEGFPNVLLEAMACGVAVISFDCPSGPRHIVRSGVDGVLVPPGDAQALAEALDRAMGDEAARNRLAANAPDLLKRFSLEKVMGMWEELILDCTRLVNKVILARKASQAIDVVEAPLTLSPDHQSLLSGLLKTWSIGIYVGESPLRLLPAPGIENPVLTQSNVSDVPVSFVADPFMIRADDAWYMFFEAKNALTRKGEIGMAMSQNGFDWSYCQIVLAEPFHLSYPYVFEYAGDYYMIPETLQANHIRLYRAASFPFEWIHCADLIDGTFADSSVFRFDDRWWMFACSSPFAHDVLRLFFADSLPGPWSEHPHSPLIRDNPRIARPAGRVVVFNDRVIRYAQDCYPRYGTQVRAFEISELTTTSYQERESEGSPVLRPGSDWNGQGMHHIDPQLNPDGKWIACVDGRFSPAVN